VAVFPRPTFSECRGSTDVLLQEAAPPTAQVGRKSRGIYELPEEAGHVIGRSNRAIRFK